MDRFFLFHVCLFELSLETCFQIVDEAELGAADASCFDELDLGDQWRVNRIDLFDSDAVADFANGEGAGRSGAFDAQDDAFKNLNALADFAFG